MQVSLRGEQVGCALNGIHVCLSRGSRTRLETCPASGRDARLGSTTAALGAEVGAEPGTRSRGQGAQARALPLMRLVWCKAVLIRVGRWSNWAIPNHPEIACGGKRDLCLFSIFDLIDQAERCPLVPTSATCHAPANFKTNQQGRV